ncbi:probable alpha-ketoglutarate-dependent hypophosphite dioxygenase [Chelonus insularis]|uniref:probable alpha-ketoglutarate-dependent hypophosphite dioxygenase n=1 Tax=Chelonus insularis TaxID=460826 RepID=UPI00158D97CB|nr:probable alpha-ketoglutarate-dependent hypophosphite dioxygenase [Chelonus insularis]
MNKLKFLTAEQHKCWQDNGYVKLSNVFTSKEMNEICTEYNQLFEQKSQENMEALEAVWIGDDMKNLSAHRNVTVKSIHNLQMHSAVFTRVITNSNLLDALEDIMDTKDILLHHTKAHIKPPEKGAPYLMHQDYPYFPHKKHTMLAVFLHLDDTTPENGGLAIYPGSHKLGPLEARTLYDDNKDAYHYVDPDRYPLSGATPISAKKGDIIVFSYLLLHGSYLNLSDRPRRMFLIQIRAADDEPTDDVHKSPCQGLVLRGRNPYRDAGMASRFAQ